MIDPSICKSFWATIGGKFAPHLMMDEDTEGMTTTFNTVMTDAGKHIIGLHHPKNKPWVTEEILEMYDTRRDLKNCRHTNGATEYCEINKKVRISMKNA